MLGKCAKWYFRIMHAKHASFVYMIMFIKIIDLLDMIMLANIIYMPILAAPIPKLHLNCGKIDYSIAKDVIRLEIHYDVVL